MENLEPQCNGANPYFLKAASPLGPRTLVYKLGRIRFSYACECNGVSNGRMRIIREYINHAYFLIDQGMSFVHDTEPYFTAIDERKRGTHSNGAYRRTGTVHDKA